MTRDVIDIKDTVKEFFLKKNSISFFNNLNRKKIDKISNTKIILISKFVNSSIFYKQNKFFWKNLLKHWVTRAIFDFYIFFNFFKKTINKKKKYKIYELNFLENIITENDYRKDPEKLFIWLAGEYIKAKNYKYIISKTYKNSKIQNKFNYFLKNVLKFRKDSLLKKIVIFIHVLLSKFILNFYKPKIIIDNIGITYFENVKLNLSLHQFPLIWDHSPKLSKKRDFQKRQMLKNNIHLLSFKDKFVTFCLIDTLPSIYLENFDNIYNYYLNKFPSSSNIYLTSFIRLPNYKRFWVNILKKNKTKTYIFQHGGLFGFYKKSLSDESELSWADKYFTWGWKLSSKYKKFFAIQFDINKKYIIKKNKSENILICTPLSTIYLNTIDSPFQTYSESYKNVKNLIKICDFLKKKLNQSIYIRYLANHQNSGFQFNEKLFKSYVKFDKAISPLREELKKYKLVIHSGISSTAFLETFFYNMPTIVLIDSMEIKKLNNDIKKNLIDLKKVGVVHFTTNSVNDFLNSNSDKIHEWWQDKKVKTAVNKFKKKFVNRNNKIMEQFKKILSSY